MNKPTFEKSLAIIGYSCCFPGGIDSPERFWQLLQAGGSIIGEIPDSRLPREFYYAPSDKNVHGKSYSIVGACIDYERYRNRVDDFVATLPFSETFSNDEGHLLSLYTAAEALRSAGYDPTDVPHRRTGVYIGHTQLSKASYDTVFSSCMEPVLEYLEEVPEFMALRDNVRENVLNDVLDAFFLRYPPLSLGKRQRLWPHDAAKNLSRAFGFSGPSMILNGECASSLLGIALAANALRQNKIDMAVVGGASYLKFDGVLHFSRAQTMSATGSKPFDSAADGFVPSEGHVYVVLKTLENARKSGDDVLAVIRGVGVSSDGKGRGLWAPKKEGQIKALQRAYAQAQIAPGELDYIEAHATSTKLGDTTELDAIYSFLKNASTLKKKVFIGGGKANLGHTLESAGLAGLVKILLSMKHEAIPAQSHVEHITESLAWDEAAIAVPLVEMPWKRSDKSVRTAAVSAVGIGGMNAHVVLQDHSPARADEDNKTNAEQRKSPTDMPIAVIGMGCVLPGAPDLASFEILLRTGTDPKTTASSDRKELLMGHRRESKRYDYCRNMEIRQLKGGYLNHYLYDWKRHKIPPVHIKYANPLQFMMLDAVDKALEDSGFSDDKPLPTDTTAVIVGTRLDSDYANSLQMNIRHPEFEKEITLQLSKQGVDSMAAASILENFSKILFERHPTHKDEAGSFTTGSLTSRIVKTYDLMGGSLVIDAGVCSSFAALEAAVNALREGQIDLAICVGGQRSMGRLAREEMLLHDDGLFPPAEGACAVILKRQDDALRDGNRIRALLHGISCCQGDNITETTEDSIAVAMGTSAPDMESVSFLEVASPCGSSVLNEHITGIERTLSPTPKKSLPLGSLPYQLGNLFGASGIAAVVKSILELEKGFCAPLKIDRKQNPFEKIGPPFLVSDKPSKIYNDGKNGSPRAIVTNVDRDGTVGVLVIEGVPFPSNDNIACGRMVESGVLSFDGVKHPTASVAHKEMAAEERSLREPPSPPQTVLVTGVSRGLGRALAERLIAEGHMVLGCDRSAKEIDELRRTYGPPHHFEVVDLCNRDQVVAWAESLKKLNIAPDFIMNNAAITGSEPYQVWKISAECYQEVITTNIMSAVNSIHAFVPLMLRRMRGIIVNFSSGQGREVAPRIGPYAVSQWGIEALSRCLAAELPNKMACVSLHPGIIPTKTMGKTFFGRVADRYPTPEEWARAAVPFLLSLTPQDNGKAITIPGMTEFRGMARPS